MATKWKQLYLGDVCTAQGSTNALIKSKQIQEYKLGLYPAFSASGQDIWREKFEHEGSAIIVSAVGARCGKCFKADGKWTAIANTHIIFPKENIGRDYLFYYINNENFWEKGGVAQPFVKIRDSLRRKLVPVPVDKDGNPDLIEQKRIVAILKEAETLKKKRNEVDQRMANVIPALFNKMFGDFSKWHQTKLGEVCHFENGKAHEEFIDDVGEFIVINSKFIASNGKVRKYSDKLLSPLLSGDVVMVMSDVPNGKALAKCFLVDENDTYTLNQRIGLFRPKDPESLDSTFLYMQLNRSQHLLGYDNHQSQTNLRKNEILNCPFFLPPIALQKEFADRVKKIEACKEGQKKSTIHIENLFSSLLSRSFTGDLARK